MTMTNDMHGTQSSLWQVGDDRSTHSNFDNGSPSRSTSLEWYPVNFANQGSTLASSLSNLLFLVLGTCNTVENSRPGNYLLVW